MSPLVHPRADWVSSNFPVSGPAFNRAEVDTFALHYTAAPDVPTPEDGAPHDSVPAYLRAIQRDYVTRRGYSIGYNFCVDQWGDAWELRGFEFKCAANKGWNHRTVAVLCLVDGAEPLNAAAVDKVRFLLAESNRIVGRNLKVRPHSEIGATACPGDGIRSQIQANMFTPWTPPTPPEEPDMSEPRYIRLKGYDDQFLAVPVSFETKQRIGWQDAITVDAELSQAELEEWAQYPLTPS